MRDDGIGLRLVEAASSHGLPDGVEAVELKNDALGLIACLGPETERILLVDCVKMGASPGGWRLFSPEEVSTIKKVARATTHEGDLLQVIELVRQTGFTVPPITVMGIEPACVEPGMELSEELSTRLEEYLGEILRILRQPTP